MRDNLSLLTAPTDNDFDLIDSDKVGSLLEEEQSTFLLVDNYHVSQELIAPPLESHGTGTVGCWAGSCVGVYLIVYKANTH